MFLRCELLVFSSNRHENVRKTGIGQMGLWYYGLCRTGVISRSCGPRNGQPTQVAKMCQTQILKSPAQPHRPGQTWRSARHTPPETETQCRKRRAATRSAAEKKKRSDLAITSQSLGRRLEPRGPDGGPSKIQVCLFPRPQSARYA